jgi:hypothetical protein
VPLGIPNDHPPFYGMFSRNVPHSSPVVFPPPGNPEFGTSALSVRTGRQATIDFAKSELRVGDKTYPVPRLAARGESTTGC